MTQEEFVKRYTYSVSHDRIGGGGFGTVYKAKDNVLHRTVAIKVSEVKTTSDGKKTFSLKDEFEALSHVPKHRNIANYEEFYSFEMSNGIFDYAVMQYYPDGNLSSAIKQGLTNEQKESVAMQLLEGVGFLHEHKVVHRDLKPSNILIVRDGEEIIPLITDFGLSKTANAGDGSVFTNSFGGGTQRYSSPEQLQGKPLRFNTDLWSYGAIVYELFTGETLFSAGSGASNSAQADLEIYNKIIHGDVENLSKMPERWRKVAERCMVVDPEQRAKSAQEMMALLKGEDEATRIETTPLPTPVATPQSYPQPAYQAPQPGYQPQPAYAAPQANVGGGKSNKGLWIVIGVFFAALVGGLLYTLLKPDPDTEAFKACYTVSDYRGYIREYGQKARHYKEARQFIQAYVDDSLTQARLEAERVEDEVYNKCTTIAACDNYLKTYPNGRYVTEVKKKKSTMEANEKEEAAYKKCTTIAACDSYLSSYPNGRYVSEVRTKKADLEEKARKEANKKAFSVSSSKKVYIASSNLQYQPSSGKWRFASNPWDYIGSANANVSSYYSGWIDLFGWGTANNPTRTSKYDSDYAYFSDWGYKMSGGWRTISHSEFDYVLYKRNTSSGIRFAKGTVSGVKGLILLPDNWSSSTYRLYSTNTNDASFSSNTISASTWNSTFAPAGAVFLPCAGYREGTSASDANSVGYYITSTAYQTDYAYAVFIGSSILDVDSWGHRYRGRSVRLVRSAD